MLAFLCRPTKRAATVLKVKSKTTIKGKPHTSDVWDATRAACFFLLPSRVHARPHAGNANRWLATSKMS